MKSRFITLAGSSQMPGKNHTSELIHDMISGEISYYVNSNLELIHSIQTNFSQLLQNPLRAQGHVFVHTVHGGLEFAHGNFRIAFKS